MPAAERIRIYRLLPRLFGNINETRQPNGTLAENGVGKFADINDPALDSLRAMGFTHLWLTGVLRQATATDHSSIGLPPDDPDLLKGLAGSPYAITDCSDVCPDYAEQPAQRFAEFQALLRRAHAHGLGVLIDFVANHVARSYHSHVRPTLDFGVFDDRARFFDPQNNFFHLQPDSPGGGPPLRLPTFAEGRALSPTCRVPGGCDGRFAGEVEHGKVTGNNAATWSPEIGDWYETAKLNYGYDFTTGARAYPHAAQPDLPIPDTWHKMDAVLAHWQALDVDGFRCDMAHMVPPEFWTWAVARARARQPAVLFLGEACDNDPMKVGPGNVLHDLLRARFDAVYDDPAYKILKGLYDGPKWANDLDAVAADAFLFERSLRYAENHDDARSARPPVTRGDGISAPRHTLGRIDRATRRGGGQCTVGGRFLGCAAANRRTASPHPRLLRVARPDGVTISSFPSCLRPRQNNPLSLQVGHGIIRKMKRLHDSGLAAPPKRRQRNANRQEEPTTRVAEEAYEAVSSVLQDLPQADNAPGAVEHMLRANGILRNLPWPAPFDRTTHRLHLGDARNLSWIADESVHLVVTSPPYWTLKEYEHTAQQLGDVEDYEHFLAELDKVWIECARVLAPGGRICCVVGDVCVPRKRHGRHYVMPLHADIQVRSRHLGLDCLTPILWQKIANGVTEAQGNGAGFYGKPYQPGAIIKNDVEYILFLRKGGDYRSPSTLQRALSMLSKEEMQSWMRSTWTDIKGESTRRGHPAPYPVALAERLIKMFSFAGDTVLDPFSGTASTALAALATGRHSLSNELEPAYHALAEQRLREAAWLPRGSGAVNATVLIG